MTTLPVTTTVIKIGGRPQTDARLIDSVAARYAALPGSLCVVHGGADAISALQRADGIEPVFVDGRRVTAPGDIDRLRMALSGGANKRLVSALVAAGVDAVGLSGEDAALLVADVADGGALGAVGVVRAVRTPLLRTLMRAGYLPVVSPLATPALNVNGDDAAAAIAVALGADGLLFISDVPGVRIGGTVVSRLSTADAAAAITSGDVTGGMAAKVRAASDAVSGGVSRVWIGDLTLLADWLLEPTGEVHSTTGPSASGTRIIGSGVRAGTGPSHQQAHGVSA
jgi:acetylglutamate kinase